MANIICENIVTHIHITFLRYDRNIESVAQIRRLNEVPNIDSIPSRVQEEMKSVEINNEEINYEEVNKEPVVNTEPNNVQSTKEELPLMPKAGDIENAPADFILELNVTDTTCDIHVESNKTLVNGVNFWNLALEDREKVGRVGL